MNWPPNRPATVSKTTIVQWRQQQPSVTSARRRPIPPHFARAFAILGWRDASWYFRANWRVICRWVNETGKEAVLAERAAMRRNPERKPLKAQMAAYWNCEPRDPVWAMASA
jgi:hypothetical protein